LQGEESRVLGDEGKYRGGAVIDYNWRGEKIAEEGDVGRKTSMYAWAKLSRKKGKASRSLYSEHDKKGGMPGDERRIQRKRRGGG